MKCSVCGKENPEGQKFCGDCGAMISQPMHLQSQYAPVPRKPPYKLRVNIFCLIGAILAVLSLFLPWMVMQESLTGERLYFGAFDVGRFSDNFSMSVTIFVIGAILTFLTPLGGIPLLIGSVGCALTVATTRFAGVGSPFFENGDAAMWYGLATAIVSAAIVVCSIVTPVGIGYERRREERISARLLTWSVYRG